jgi:hypothetical protein
LEIRPSESTTPDSAADAAIDERIESAVESPSTGSTRGSIPRQFPRRSWTAAKQTQVPVPHRIRTPMARSGRKWLHVRGNIEREWSFGCRNLCVHIDSAIERLLERDNSPMIRVTGSKRIAVRISKGFAVTREHPERRVRAERRAPAQDG